MRITAVQHDIVWCDPAATRAHVAPAVAGAAAAGAELVLLTETFSTGFATESNDIAEPEGGPSSTFLVESALTHGVWVGATVAEVPEGDDDRRPFNTFVLAGPDGTTHRYRKVHRFTPGGEDRVFRAGTEPCTVRIGDLGLTLMVCYDLRFAPDFWAAAPRTDVYLVPANWPARRRDHWRTLLAARAVENQAYVVGCNRVGSGGGIDYAGDSCIIDPDGRVLASAAEVETTVTADVRAERVREVRARLPFLEDRT